jgi:hypothetical protein
MAADSVSSILARRGQEERPWLANTTMAAECGTGDPPIRINVHRCHLLIRRRERFQRCSTIVTITAAAIKTTPAILTQMSVRSFGVGRISKNARSQLSHEATVRSTILLHCGHCFLIVYTLRWGSLPLLCLNDDASNAGGQWMRSTNQFWACAPPCEVLSSWGTTGGSADPVWRQDQFR